MIRYFISYLWVTAWMFIPSHFAVSGTIASLNEAVDVAGHQRMHITRMLRDYALIGMKISYADPARDLKKSQAAFEEGYRSLKSYIDDPKLTEEIQQLGAFWEKAKPVLSQTPRKEQMNRLARLSFVFAEHYDTFIKHLAQTQTQNTTVKAINIADRLRAVSQAIAAIYQLRVWGVPDADKIMQLPMQYFRESLDFLKQAPETDASMRMLLSDLEKIYSFFEIMNGTDVMTPVLAIKKAETMFAKADALTRRYMNLQQTRSE